jgi:lipopolysaccharide export system permease protein
VFGSLLHRTILVELLRVFALALVGITGILVMAGIMVEASQQGLTPAQVLSVIPLLIPSSLPYTIPATTLFATCVVYGRLAADNEILAIKAAGINVLKVIWPAVFLGIVTSAVTMGLYYQLIPYTHFVLRSQFLNEVEESCYTLLKKDRCIKQPGLNYCMWVQQVQGRRLYQALFKRKDAHGHYDVIAKAREAELHYDPEHQQLLVSMQHCYLYAENGSGAGYVQSKVWPVDLPKDFGVLKNPKPRAMSCPGLVQRIRDLRQQIDTMGTETAMAQARMALNQPPDDLPRHVFNLGQKQHQYWQEIYSLQTELNLRPALSMGCLCFVLVGCPVGIWFSRSDYLSAFISCFLPIVFIYYPLVLCGTNLAKQNRLPATMSVWAADVFMALVAFVLFRKLLKH